MQPFEPVKVQDWLDTVKRMRLGRTLKAVAIVYATYASYETGLNVRPGTARVSVEAEVSYDTAKSCTAKLRDLGLLVRVGRYGNTTHYRLALPDIGRHPVPNPTQHELAIANVRSKVKGKYKPAKDLRVAKHPADAQEDTTCGGNDYPQTENPAGGSTPPQKTPAGDPTKICGEPITPLSLMDHPLQVVPTCNPHSDNDLLADVTDPSEAGRDETDSLPDDVPLPPPTDLVTRPRCRHGRSTRNRPDGTPRCNSCRTENTTQQPAQAVNDPAEGETCDHRWKTALRRPDGSPKCPACHRGLTGQPGKESTA